MLADSGVISGFKTRLLDVGVPVRKKRAALWALGFIGASNKSVDRLVEHDLVSIIVNMAETSPHLSLRGTACYVLNMISGSKLGRKRIEKLNWANYDMSDRINSAYLNGRVCLPKDMKQIFNIPDMDSNINEVFFANQTQYWDMYSKTLKMKSGTVEENHKMRFIACITEMCFLMNPGPQEEISKIYSSHKEIFGDPLLFHQFVTVLTYARFRSSKIRAFLFMLLDKFLQDQSFNLWGLNQCIQLGPPISKDEKTSSSEGDSKPFEQLSLNGSEFDLI